MKKSIRKRVIIVCPEKEFSGSVLWKIRSCMKVARGKFSISHAEDLLKWVLVDSTDTKFHNFKIIIKVIPLVGGLTRAFDIVSTCYVDTRDDRKIAREIQRNFRAILSLKNVDPHASVASILREHTSKKGRETA